MCSVQNVSYVPERTIYPVDSFSQNFQSLPNTVQQVVKQIADSKLATRITLFGSRARGDHRANSDFDIAVEWNAGFEIQIRHLENALLENPISLYKIDLLNWDHASQSYRTEIQREGKLLWQKKA